MDHGVTPAPTIADLRRLIARADGIATPDCVLPFGVDTIDAHLPGGGLALGGVHEFIEDGPRAAFAAHTVLFVAGILARLPGPVLWCLHRRDLFAPALARVGLDPNRIVFCETWKDADILPAMEEGLRARGFAGVVGELKRLPLTPSRRLALAAEATGVTAFVVSRAGDQKSEANAVQSRWCISSLPSAPDALDVLGRPRWQLDLLRCRGAAPQSWIVEACDAQGRCVVPADIRNRPSSAGEWRQAAS